MEWRAGSRRWPAGFQNITTCPVPVATGVRGSAGTGGWLAIGQNPEGGGARAAERERAGGRGRWRPTAAGKDTCSRPNSAIGAGSDQGGQSARLPGRRQGEAAGRRGR